LLSEKTDEGWNCSGALDEFFLELGFCWIGGWESFGEVCLLSMVGGGTCMTCSSKATFGGWKTSGEFCLSSMVEKESGGGICLSCSSKSTIGGWDSRAEFSMSSMSISFVSEGGNDSTGGTREGGDASIGGTGLVTPSVEFFPFWSYLGWFRFLDNRRFFKET